MDGITAKELKKEPTRHIFEISVDRNSCFEEEKKVFREVSSTAQIAGFRKGKAPEELLRKNYAEYVRERTVQRMLEIASREILTGRKLAPLSPPVVDKIREYSDSKDLVFEYAVEIMPEVRLGDYKGLKAEKTVPKIEAQDVENAVQRMRLENSKLEDKDADSVTEGDFAVISYVVSDKKSGSETRKNDSLLVEIEPESRNKFSAALVGMKKGERRKVDLENNVFDVVLKDIKKRVLPAEDAAFAALFGFPGTDELRAKIKQELQLAAERESDKELREKLIDELVSKNPVEVPESLLEARLHEIKHKVEHDMEKYGTSLEKAGMTEEKFREKYRPAAEKGIKAMLVLHKISEVEKLSVTDEELQAEKKRLVEENPGVKDHVDKYFAENADSIRYDLKEKKVVDYIVANARIKEVKKNRK